MIQIRHRQQFIFISTTFLSNLSPYLKLIFNTIVEMSYLDFVLHNVANGKVGVCLKYVQQHPTLNIKIYSYFKRVSDDIWEYNTSSYRCISVPSAIDHDSVVRYVVNHIVQLTDETYIRDVNNGIFY
jgi:hypothetical protein